MSLCAFAYIFSEVIQYQVSPRARAARVCQSRARCAFYVVCVGAAAVAQGVPACRGCARARLVERARDLRGWAGVRAGGGGWRLRGSLGKKSFLLLSTNNSLCAKELTLAHSDKPVWVQTSLLDVSRPIPFWPCFLLSLRPCPHPTIPTLLTNTVFSSQA